MEASPGRADLSEDAAFLLELLDDTHAWRERLVEEFIFGAASHVGASSSYQIDIPRELLSRYVDLDESRSANVLLPLTTRPTRALLSFDLVGPSGAPAHVVTRKNAAAPFRRFLAELQLVGGVSTGSAAHGSRSGHRCGDRQGRDDVAGDGDLLSAVAEYGRRYELIVETEIPLLEPSTIRLREDRPLRLHRFGRSTHRFALGDARSAHMEARLADPNVRLGRRPAARTIDGDQIGIVPLESVRETDETLSIYSAETERPYYVDIELRLIPRLQLRLTAWIVVAMTAAATAVALWRGGERDLHARLAVLVVPTTLAATVALAREQTALASRLQTIPRAGLMLAIMILWGVALAQVLIFRPPGS